MVKNSRLEFQTASHICDYFFISKMIPFRISFIYQYLPNDKSKRLKSFRFQNMDFPYNAFSGAVTMG